MTIKRNDSPDFQQILAENMSRRKMLGTLFYGTAAVALAGCGVNFNRANNTQNAISTPSTLTFKEISHDIEQGFAVPEHYQTQVLIRWGDPIFSDAPDFDPIKQTEQAQLRQFGYNNDFIGFVPLPFGSNQSDRGLLTVNHEYVNSELMFPGSPKSENLNKEQCKINMAAHGLSVIEIRKLDNGQWQPILNSHYNRRITPHTEMQLTGPAAGNKRLKSHYSKDGIKTFGTYGNCAGGVTPWGTILTGEENIDWMFGGDFSNSGEQENYQRFGMKSKFRGSWGKHDPRFDMSKTPKEPLHVGWIVEIDPFNPDSVPKKRTALGRFKHEGANIFINADNKVVAYSGDDQRFEYLYKFVSAGRYQKDDRDANLNLLEAGTLYCAKFKPDGSVNWLKMQFGEGPLTKENGFYNQGDVQLDCRKAADLLGATPMDRPEDVDINPVTGQIYVMLTNNSRRQSEQIDGPNPRPNNKGGQVLELTAPNGDHSLDSFSWELLLICGPKEEAGTQYHANTSELGWLACPDNCAFDLLGNLWISTDGAQKFGIADGVWATETQGVNRGLTKRFLKSPIGSELCGPFFTPDSENFFCAVQHPGERSSYDNPSTRWPDFNQNTPPRPAVVVVTKKDGGRVGS